MVVEARSLMLLQWWSLEGDRPMVVEGDRRACKLINIEFTRSFEAR
jgi:hypothetical protein